MSIKAISFDLDDTLWPILPIINKAEEITNKWLVKNYPGVEKLLKGKELVDISNKLLEKRKNLASVSFFFVCKEDKASLKIFNLMKQICIYKVCLLI